MVKIKLRYLVEDVDRHGNVRVYFRRKGQRKIRLTGLPGSDQFMEAYRKCLAGLQAPDPKQSKGIRAAKGSFKWLCEEYFASAEFKQLDLKTGLVRRRLLDRLCQLYGDKPASRVEPIHIRKMRDSLADKPEAANSLLKALRQLFSFGSAYGYMHYNAARDIPYIKAKGDGFHTWTEREIAQFEAHHPIESTARLSMALMLYTGQRRSDAIRLGRQHIRNGMLEFTQHKNRSRNPVSLSIPIHPTLQEILAANSHGKLQFIVTEFGKPFSDAGFGNRFRKWCDEAGLPKCTAHGLRKAAATLLAEAGCTEREIMAITGHRTSKQVSRYAQAANQVKLAGQAISKLVGDETQNRRVPLSEGVEQSGTLLASNTLKA